jgi:methionine synthase I (cobalamin-dependent)
MHPIEQQLEKRILIIDGAMGTMIQRHKLSEEDFIYKGEEFIQDSRWYTQDTPAIEDTIKAIDKNGNIVEQLLEVKPKKETTEPTKKKRITKQYITEVTTWGKNQAKWKAAEEYCLDRGWQFKLITEKELGIK